MNALERLTTSALLAPVERPGPAVLPLRGGALQPLGRALERILGLSTLNEIYAGTRLRSEPHFADRALGVLDIGISTYGDLDVVPAVGPLIVIANHPHGALDGLALASLLARRRADARLLANRLLVCVPELRRHLVLVDPFQTRRAVDRNRQALREAVRWLRGGGCLCVFPAGTVSHVRAGRGRVVDPVWLESLGRLVHLTGADVVPCFIEGRNSVAFQLAGMVHPVLRTLLLPRELLRARGRAVAVHVGVPVAAHELPREAAKATAALRARTDALDPRSTTRSPARIADDVMADLRARATHEHVGVASERAPRALAREVAPLIESQALARGHALTVFWASASQAPCLLQEIGRARERTFRAAGEGTGGDVDLDRFDDRYLHLCVWDERAGDLAGAYRMRATGESLVSNEILYTQTLFRYDARLVRRLSPALELGRAFVKPEYQRQYAPLMLLWSGIGRYARSARVRHLFGAVSISSAYSPAARDAIVSFLRRHALDGRLARLVSPRHPVGSVGDLDTEPREAAADVRALNERVMSLDPTGKGVPVLLRQYLKLGGRVLGFSVDPGFGHTIDALMVVDLNRVPPETLRRYRGAN